MAQIYGSVADADAYNLAIGNTAWASLSNEVKAAALLRGSIYVDSYNRRYIGADYRCWFEFPGIKTGGLMQEREWPRTGVTGVPDDLVPPAVEQATYEAAAREANTPGSLRPDVNPATVVKREKVDVLEVEYAVGTTGQGALSLPTIPVIDSLLASLLIRRCNYGGIAVYAV